MHRTLYGARKTVSLPAAGAAALGATAILLTDDKKTAKAFKSLPEFDKTAAKHRVERMWALTANFGLERNAYRVYIDELIRDRYALINGMQLIRDELQLAFNRARGDAAYRACGADVTLPSVLTTLAHTNCGDRIHQGDATSNYVKLVAGRFASLSEIGELKLEAFAPTGGGTDDGSTLAHVTVAHQIDPQIKHQFYSGNPQSYVLVNIDLKTHVGRIDVAKGQPVEARNHWFDTVETVFGKAQESLFRDPRDACGAIVGCITNYNDDNPVHRRLRRDLGEENWQYLQDFVYADDGTPVTSAIAAAIVALRGMLNTLDALASELDERGVGHCTASVTLNRCGQSDTVLYVARGTVFNGEIKVQGLGLDATKYRARMVERNGDRRLLLEYDNKLRNQLPIVTRTYDVSHAKQKHASALVVKEEMAKTEQEIKEAGLAVAARKRSDIKIGSDRFKAQASGDLPDDQVNQ